MALHDLTPQLRTRLSRMERAVGWFVLLALLALVFGFGYYLYNTAERKGWFKVKAPYFTFTASAAGLRVGDPIQLMGKVVGRITRIDPQPPEDRYNMYVEFEVQSPYYGYLWTEGSRAKVVTADLLGNRVIEVTKGTNGYPTYVFNPLREVSPEEAASLPNLDRWVFGEEVYHPTTMDLIAQPMQPLTNLGEMAALGITNLVVLDCRETRKLMTGVWNDREERYLPYVRGKGKYWLLSDESPAVTERLEQLVNQVQKSMPGVFALTNQLSLVLSNAGTLMATLNDVAIKAQPAVSNIVLATAGMDRPGALGEWLLPTNINSKLDTTLGTASTTMDAATTNMAALAIELSKSLENLASMTSNLNTQVQSNTNILSAISKTVVDSDNFIEGLKHHWLLRSAFKSNEKKVRPTAPPETLLSPKAAKE